MTEPLRVLHIVRKMDIGGVQLMLMNYYRNINREKVQFDFIVQGSEPGFFDNEIYNLGGNIYRVTPMQQSLLKYNKDIKQILKNLDCQVVHIHHNFANIYAATQAYRTNINNIISHSHATYSEKSFIRRVIKSLIQYRLNTICNYKLACSKQAGEWLYGKNITKEKEVIILPNSIDVQTYNFDRTLREKKRIELKVSDSFLIGHVGSFSFFKNHEFLVEIFKEVHKQRSDAKLLLVGTGEMENTIRNKVKNLGLDKHVIFTGKRPDINELLQACDVFLFPSINEGLGIALIEAQASGLRCIVSREIPEEAKVTDLVDFISLRESSAYWANIVLKYADGYKRENTLQKLRDSGYDIKEQAKKLESIYLEMI